MFLRQLASIKLTSSIKCFVSKRTLPTSVVRCYSTSEKGSTHQQQHQKQSQNSRQPEKSVFESLVERRGGQDLSTHVSFGQKAKETAKTATSTVVVACVLGLVGLVGYLLYRELFSRETPTGIYNESSKYCLDDYKVREALGEPIKVSAESGGRRVFNIRHKFFPENNYICLIINYYLTGAKNKGLVHVKVKKDEMNKPYEYEYIIVELDFPYRGETQIVVKNEKNK